MAADHPLARRRRAILRGTATTEADEIARLDAMMRKADSMAPGISKRAMEIVSSMAADPDADWNDLDRRLVNLALEHLGLKTEDGHEA
jgi:hypothetical protein